MVRRALWIALIAVAVLATSVLASNVPQPGGTYSGPAQSRPGQLKLHVANNLIDRVQWRVRGNIPSGCRLDKVIYNPKYVKVTKDLKLPVAPDGSFSGVDHNLVGPQNKPGKKGKMSFSGQFTGAATSPNATEVMATARFVIPARGGKCAFSESFSGTLAG